MPYIISYEPREYVIAGIFIPKKGYTPEQLAMGKREAISVSDQQLATLQDNFLFKSLLAEKKVRILDKVPVGLLSGEERMAALQAENKALKAQLKGKE